MKRILTIIAAVASLLLFATSCHKDEYGKHSFFTNVIINVRDQARADIIATEIHSDPYFSTIHSYTAKFSEAVVLAANEFEEHVKALDAELIEGQLQFGENVRISLWSMDPGNKWLTYLFTPDYGPLTEEKNF